MVLLQTGLRPQLAPRFEHAVGKSSGSTEAVSLRFQARVRPLRQQGLSAWQFKKNKKKSADSYQQMVSST